MLSNSLKQNIEYRICTYQNTNNTPGHKTFCFILHGCKSLKSLNLILYYWVGIWDETPFSDRIQERVWALFSNYIIYGPQNLGAETSKM